MVLKFVRSSKPPSKFVQSLSFELSPVAAIVGGILASEILKAISVREREVSLNI